MYSFSSLFGDTKNFMRHYWLSIFVVTAIFLCVNEVCITMTTPTEQTVHALFEKHHLQSFQDVITLATQQSAQTDPAQMTLFSDFFAVFKNYLITSLFFSLASFALFPTLIFCLSQNAMQNNIFLKNLLRNFFAMILFCLVLTALCLGFGFLIALFMPLIYVLIVALFIMTLLFQTLLIAAPELSFGQKFKRIFGFFKKESKLILLGAGFYLLVYLLLNFCFSFLPDSTFSDIFIAFLLLLLNQFILIYLYRLYSLSFKANDAARSTIVE